MNNLLDDFFHKFQMFVEYHLDREKLYIQCGMFAAISTKGRRGAVGVNLTIPFISWLNGYKSCPISQPIGIAYFLSENYQKWLPEYDDLACQQFIEFMQTYRLDCEACLLLYAFFEPNAKQSPRAIAYQIIEVKIG